jgi:hypothetical protein
MQHGAEFEPLTEAAAGLGPLPRRQVVALNDLTFGRAGDRCRQAPSKVVLAGRAPDAVRTL